jgi:hypothetical protein
VNIHKEEVVNIIVRKELKAIWDEDKKRIFNTANKGCFSFNNMELGMELVGNWWIFKTQKEKIIGYGWINTSQGDAEVSVIINVRF